MRAYAQDEDDRLKYLLRLVRKPPPYVEPKERMYLKNEAIHCTGKSKAATANNKAAGLMSDGNFEDAEKILKNGLIQAPLFFPFRYNIGLCYIHLSQFKAALLNLEKAIMLLPEFSKTYLQIGYIYERLSKNDSAIDYYKNALARNPKELKVFTIIGDMYYNRSQLEMAKKYYMASLELAPRNGGGLLGLAKIHFRKKEYFRATIKIKSIAPGAEYDISLHYYYAECAYKLRDYKTAFDQYTTLLKFKADKFFLTNSAALIKHKLKLCERFIGR